MFVTLYWWVKFFLFLMLLMSQQVVLLLSLMCNQVFQLLHILILHFISTAPSNVLVKLFQLFTPNLSLSVIPHSFILWSIKTLVSTQKFILHSLGAHLFFLNGCNLSITSCAKFLKLTSQDLTTSVHIQTFSHIRTSTLQYGHLWCIQLKKYLFLSTWVYH